MSKDVIYFAENICGIKLADWQKDLLRQTQEANDKGELILVNLGRRQGVQLLNNILINFQIWSKTQQISDLEAKLEESEENNKLLEMQLQDMERSKLSWENQYFTLYNTHKNYREVTEKKLAEKDEKIETQRKNLEFFYDIFNNPKSQQTLKTINHDKISFALEQLEKVKENIKKCNYKDFGIMYQSDAIKQVDNQINQLKEMK